ncbi:MAG: hypothetical protein CMO82_14135 [Winogradskyella sp.]|nr:hypothetical protein [Winogradskyella sp.]|tara:strand:- start:265 stop:699 length:435 start_codon:yes stop_codon:yes gene_type:complete
MLNLKATKFYDNVLKELNYPFADIFIFKGYVISEIKEGVVFSWEEHAKIIVKDVTSFTKTDGSNLVYLSHRVNSYSLKPMDWLYFYKNSFNLKGYGVIGYNSFSFLNTVVENLFFSKKIRRFGDLETAVQWAKSRVLINVNNKD